MILPGAAGRLQPRPTRSTKTMKQTALTLGVILMALGAVMAQAAPPTVDAAAASAEGLRLLQQGKVEEALRSCQAAFHADSNPEYLGHMMAVRQMLRARRALATLEDEERWVQLAQALRALYDRYQMHGDRLALDLQLHERLDTPASATRLARSQLQLGKHQEALTLLRGIEAAQADGAIKTLLGLAHARLGQTEEAEHLLEATPVADDAGPRVLFDRARLCSLLGKAQAANRCLTRALEATPPTELEATRARIEQSPDLVAAREAPEFAQTLATESKVKQSSCSSGSGCAGCSMRESCTKQQDQECPESKP
jgi:tetratricopeptide (TPR) repeat protein